MDALVIHAKGEKMRTAKIRTNVYLDQETKIKAQELFNQYHISLSDAINMFLSQSVLNQGLPFEMKIPNKDTMRVIKDIQNNRNIEEITLDDLKSELKERIV